MLTPTTPGPGKAPAQPLASAQPSGSAGAAPAGTNSALATAQVYGGNPGGRPRKDGLRPGSPEAREVDREKERIRKANYRARLEAQNPPVIPAALPAAPGAVQPPAPGQAPLPAAALPEAGPIAWQPEHLRPLFEELVPNAEAELVARLTTKAADAKLPTAVLREIEKDARWSNTTKTGLIVGGPEVSAKWLNKLGIGAENRAEIIFGGAITAVVFSHMRLERRLNKLIEEARKTAAPAPTEEKKT